MNDNNLWPRVGQAAASRTARILARYASWQLAEVAAYHGLPLAAFLHDEATALLVAVVDGPLEPAMAAMHASLLETRSDALLIREEGNGVGEDASSPLPQVALGLWWAGYAAWHHALLPWLADDGTMWLVPEVEVARTWQHPAFRLVARHLRRDLLPWRTDEERLGGFARAVAVFESEQA